MSEEFFDLEWPVAPDYRWEDWLGANGSPVLATRFDIMAPNTMKAFEVKRGHETGPVLMCVEGKPSLIRPMDRQHAALFRTFSEIDGTDRGAILQFARKYGWLGIERQDQFVSTTDGTHYAEGECWAGWLREIAQMREAIGLSQSKSDSKHLKWLLDYHLQKVQGRMHFRADDTAQLRITPLTLLAAMWLQLALAIAGEKRFVHCKHCSRQIEISTAETGFRTNREFCSDSCKTNHYRKRKREALQHARDGKGLVEISKLVATERETVRDWLDTFKARNKKRGSK